ncbi:MAG: hypothetical protein R3213_00540, partial [Flavobacteriaceae bacterium]|nr:hypothetical protein [Flavobacteriaceae bacterium]
MNKKGLTLFLISIFTLPQIVISQSRILSAETKFPVSYATISFDNGYGMFADDEGYFVFTEKIYPGIDSLHLSALGFKDVTVSSMNLPEIIYMEEEPAELQEVVVRAFIDRSFDKETIKPYLDDDYYKCWLPTIESEIAVYFSNNGPQTKKITEVHFPLALES